MKTKEAAEKFLNLETIAIAGYSTSGQAVGNHIYKKMKDEGYNVVALNPRADEIKNVTCFKDIASMPMKPDGVFIASPPDATPALVKQCAENGVKSIWIHKTFGNGSYHPEAIKIASDNNIMLIPAGCPMMYVRNADGFHKCFKWIFSMTGRIPKSVDES